MKIFCFGFLENGREGLKNVAESLLQVASREVMRAAQLVEEKINNKRCNERASNLKLEI